MDNLKFGAFLAQLRKEKGLTQKELADRLSVTDKAVSKWETGKGFPDLKLMEPLAQELDVSLVELLQGERQQTDTLTAEQAEQVVKQAMERSERVTTRGYLRLLRWLLTGIGVLCALPFVSPGLRHLRTWLFMLCTGYSIIGGADGPTAILVSTSDNWLLPVALLAVLVVCIVMALRVWRLEKKLK